MKKTTLAQISSMILIALLFSACRKVPPTCDCVCKGSDSTVAKVTLPQTTLAAGRSYTIWAKGIYTDTGLTGLGGEIMRNY